MQKEAPEKYQEKIFEDFKEPEEQREKEALALAEKKHMLIKCVGEREKGKDHAKVGGVKCKRSMVRRQRQFLVWFLLIFPGPLHRRGNVFFQDGARGW